MSSEAAKARARKQYADPQKRLRKIQMMIKYNMDHHEAVLEYYRLYHLTRRKDPVHLEMELT